MTHEDLMKLQETNNKAIIAVQEMIGDLPPPFEPEPLAFDMLQMLLYTREKIENDIAAVSHGVYVR